MSPKEPENYYLISRGEIHDCISEIGEKYQLKGDCMDSILQLRIEWELMVKRLEM